MKRAVLALACSLLLPACTSLRRPVVCAGHLVVPANTFPPSYDQTARFDPTEDEIAACERALARKLWWNGHHLRDYCLRLEGVIQGGERHIAGKAGVKGRGGENYLMSPRGDGVVMMVFGGGESFFCFDYDCSKAKLAEFMFNAPL
jgi:hypothetical protein